MRGEREWLRSALERELARVRCIAGAYADCRDVWRWRTRLMRRTFVKRFMRRCWLCGRVARC